MVSGVKIEDRDLNLHRHGASSGAPHILLPAQLLRPGRASTWQAWLLRAGLVSSPFPGAPCRVFVYGEQRGAPRGSRAGEQAGVAPRAIGERYISPRPARELKGSFSAGSELLLVF